MTAAVLAIQYSVLDMTSVFALHSCMVSLLAYTVIVTYQTQCLLTIPALHFMQGLARS